MTLAGAAALLLITPTTRASQTAEAREKSDLRILLVSHDPKAVQPPFSGMEDERSLALYAERAELFGELFGEHFENVKVVYGGQYEPSMSDDADVTVFDARPNKLEIPGAEGRNYLPLDFDRATLMISENSPLIGEALGSKMDWL